MEEKNKITRELIRIGQIVLGNTMYALAVVMFIVPNGLITGGTTGLALFASHTVGIPISLFVIIFNITMFILGAWILGKQFAVTTVISTIIYPVMLGLLEGSGFGGFVLEEKMVAVIYAGILIGGGIGIVMRAGASTGGMDIPSLILKKKFDVNISFSLYLMDCVVLGLQFIVADSHAILYGILLIIVYTMVLNKVLMSGNVRIQVKVVTRYYERINRLIAERLDCGTSLLHMETGYLHKEQDMILAVIARRDLPKLNQLVMDQDPEAFMIINQINEVRGRGFTMKRVYQDAAYQEADYGDGDQ